MSSALDESKVERTFIERDAVDDALIQRLEQLNDIGTSLSAERDINRLLETILSAAKAILGADGGTLYRVTEDNTLRFEYASTSYDDPQTTEYQSILEGFNEHWSAWSPEVKRDYTNLPPGHFVHEATNVGDAFASGLINVRRHDLEAVAGPSQ